MRMSAMIMTLALVALVPAFVRADDLPNINKRGAKGSEDEKKFITDLTTAVCKAAHSTGKNPLWTKFDYSVPKERRAELTISLEYKGNLTGTKYTGEAVLLFDTADEKKWELLSIEFKDKNNNIPPSKDKLTKLVKSLNEVK